jgi:hypothetical protein
MDMNNKVLWKTKRAPLFDKGSMILAGRQVKGTEALIPAIIGISEVCYVSLSI